jgi:inosine/xanthosine triphosphatase
MDVALGSRNPVKHSATERALPGASVTPLSVDSGVSEQPTGHPETRRGAENRAERALRAGEFDLGVGIEGGVASATDWVSGEPSDPRTGVTRLEPADGLWLVMWAATTDGERTGRGAGPSLRLPESIADRVDAGEELGPVMDDVLGEENVKQRQGAAGALTGGVIDREDALVAALGGALGPFLTDHY